MDKDLYESVIEPHHLDDGDIDDIHRYNNWYGVSVRHQLEVWARAKKNLGTGLIGQEMSSGYSDLDTAAGAALHTRSPLTPQAWVGQSAYPGSDPSVFLEHDQAVTKRWVSNFGMSEANKTAGFMLFAQEAGFRIATIQPRSLPTPFTKASNKPGRPLASRSKPDAEDSMQRKRGRDGCFHHQR